MRTENYYKLGLKSNEIAVLIYLSILVKYNESYPSLVTIGKNCGIKSKKTVIKILRSLEDYGFISIHKKDFCVNNFYVINFSKLEELTQDESKQDSFILSDYIKEQLEHKNMI
jgi:hypothetical protein